MSSDLLLRFLQATPEQQAAIEAILGHASGEARPGTGAGFEASESKHVCAGARRWDIGELLSGIHQEIAAVRKDFREMRTVKERLEQMQGEKLFAFTNGIDPESFRVLCSVLANGDVAKASRALNVSDSTLRTRMAEWKNRGPAYKVLLELVRWRKEMGRKGTAPLNESITGGTAANADYAGLLADVLDEVLSMNDENWAEKADALAELLRPYVGR